MPQDLLGRLLLADVVAVNLGISLSLASLASDEWLCQADSTWSDAARARATLARRAGLVVTALGLVCAVWFQAALMADAPLWRVGTTGWVLLRDTHFGHAAAAGGVSWAVVMGLSWSGERLGRTRRWSAAIGLAALVWSRSVVAHAGSQGDLSLDVALDVAHMFAALVWVGIVLLAVSLRLPALGAPTPHRLDATRWVASLSSTATVALVVVIGTGVFKVWRAGTSVVTLMPSDYGLALGSKVALVAVAAALGGFNRFRVLPSLFGDLQSDVGDALHRPWRKRLETVLRFEALVLLLVLVAAAVLASTEPPSS
jgi:putative copper resistance protein D